MSLQFAGCVMAQGKKLVFIVPSFIITALYPDHDGLCLGWYPLCVVSSGDVVPPLTTDLFVLVLDYRIAGKRGGGGNSEFCYNKQQRTYKVTNETGLHGGNY